MNAHSDFQQDDFKSDRAEELLQRYFDETIVEDERRELLSLWEERPELLETAADQYDIEHLFRFFDRVRRQPPVFSMKRSQQVEFPGADLLFSQTERIEPKVLEELVQMVLFRESGTFAVPEIADTDQNRAAPPSKTERSGKGGKNASWISTAWLMMGVFVIFGLGVYSEFFYRPSSPHLSQAKLFRPIARIDSVIDAAWNEDAPVLKEGQYLESDVIGLQSGIVQLLMNNGVRVAVEGPAEVRLNTIEKIFCGRGKISATVPPEASPVKGGGGFEVVTPFLSVVDLGTEFFVHVDSKHIETHTIRGKVELNRLAHEKIELDAGHAFEFDSNGRSRRFEAEPNRFLTGLFVRAMQEKQDAAEFGSWKEQKERIRTLPGLRLFYDFENAGGDLVDPVVGPGGRLFGAKRSQGRWQGKKAVAFHRKNDAVVFEFAPTLRSMTLVASIRPDSLGRNMQVLLGSRGMDVGHFLWQLVSDGSFQLAVRPAENAPYVLFRTQPVLQPRNLGAWYQLATVVDDEKRSVRFYLDGDPVGEFSTSASIPFHLDEATLGNHLPDKKTSTDSSFDGRIDQLLIFDRPLGEAEIRTL